MTKIELRRGPQGNVLELHAFGHTGYAQQGEDIVCAGVSALMLTAAIAAQRLGGQVEISEETADVHILWGKKAPPQHAMEVQHVLRAIVDGLIATQEQYPNYLIVQEV